ncbi:MAG: Rrf2 family transcriptional regulator [Nitrospirota bacterium]|nr:Rrf2 family transcriptional regulator [Nitrospirota bacterium]
MLVTRETDYAIRTVLFLAGESKPLASVSEIAKAMHIPKSFLAKIVQRLVKSGILSSIRGVAGGFRLARKPEHISLLAIMESIQGDTGINICATDKRLCRMSSTCVVHPLWVEIRQEVEKRLLKKTIKDLTKKKR